MTDVERKLELTRFLREEDRANRMKIKTREEILYGSGKPSDSRDGLSPVYGGDLYGEHWGERGFEAAGEARRMSGFGIRLCLACLLFGAVVCLDKNEVRWNGKEAAAVVSSQVEADFGIDTVLKKYYDYLENKK